MYNTLYIKELCSSCHVFCIQHQKGCVAFKRSNPISANKRKVTSQYCFQYHSFTQKPYKYLIWYSTPGHLSSRICGVALIKSDSLTSSQIISKTFSNTYGKTDGYTDGPCAICRGCLASNSQDRNKSTVYMHVQHAEHIVNLTNKQTLTSFGLTEKHGERITLTCPPLMWKDVCNCFPFEQRVRLSYRWNTSIPIYTPRFSAACRKGFQ